jgi:RHS repeat-associated protein
MYSTSSICGPLGCDVFYFYTFQVEPNIPRTDPSWRFFHQELCNVATWVPASSPEYLETLNSSKSQCIEAHSYINVDSLALVEDIPLTGTPFDLYYSSDRYRSNFVYSPKNLGLGGWEPSILHHYDVTNKVIYFGSGGQRPIPALTSNGNLVVASEEGHELYVFDSQGKHLQTKNALTNNLKYSFSYDASGKLSSVVDQFGKQTLIQRISASQIKIISSYNQETLLTLDANNLLVSILNPNNESYQITYNSAGYLDSFTKPMGQKSVVSYDANGFVTKDLGAGGDFVSLLREFEASSKTQTVTSSTAMGRKTIYKTTVTTLGVDRTIEETIGEIINQITQEQGDNSSSSSDGTVLQSTLEQDPRYGWMSPYEKAISYKILNSNIDVSIKNEKTFVNSVLTTKTTLQNDPSKTFIESYDTVNKVAQSISPLNRVATSQLDSQGQVISHQVASLEPVNMSYDLEGKLTQINQKDRNISFTYNQKGNVDKYTDVLGNVTSYEYDNSDRIIKATLPNGNVITLSYDKNGNLISLTPSGKPAHQFSYNLMELASSYLPPAINAQVLGQEIYEYNLDKQMTKLNKPNGDFLSFNYHSINGLLTGITSQQEQLSLVYQPNSSLLKNLNHSSGLNLEYSYTGKILKSVKTSGLLNNQISFNFNPDASVSEVQVSGADNEISSTPLSYDKDGLLIKAGNLNYTRNNFGAIAAANIGNQQSTNSFNNFGEIINAQSKYKNQILAEFKYSRDKFTRVSSVVESLRGMNGWLSNTKNQYEYDKLGRLVKAINKGRQTVYQYDGNGNRIKKSSFGENITADYDEQDRLVRYGNIYYSYNANGELILKTEKRRVHFFKTIEKKTQYFYDSFGNLSKVILPNQKVIEYIMDGQGRRVGKKVDGVLTEGYIYQNQTQIIAVTDGSGIITKRFVYGEKINSPDILIMNSKEYRIISDQVGTPRLVVDLSNGRVKEELNFDEFGDDPDIDGRKILPFGFAGGLYDRDTKLVHFGQREYLAEVGRWISKDKIGFAGGDMNLYGYVLQDPVNLIDPFGLFDLPSDPSGLPEGWVRDPSHNIPGGRWRYKDTDRYLDFHPGKPKGSRGGAQKKDHWHDSLDGRHKPKIPGQSVPDPEDTCPSSGSSPKFDNGSKLPILILVPIIGGGGNAVYAR